MKPGSIGDPDSYLGGKLTQFEIENPATGDLQLAWGLSPTKYVQTAIANIEEYHSKNFYGRKLPKKDAKSPFDTNYQLELDRGPELNGKLLTVTTNPKSKYLDGW